MGGLIFGQWISYLQSRESGEVDPYQNLMYSLLMMRFRGLGLRVLPQRRDFLACGCSICRVIPPYSNSYHKG